MNPLARWWLALLGCVRLAAAPSAEDFARLPEFEKAQLSPDGKLVALLHHEKRESVVLIWNLATRRMTRFESSVVYDGDGTRPTTGIRDFRWLTPNRMLFKTEASSFNDYSYTGYFRANLEAAIANTQPPANMSQDDFRAKVLLDNAGRLMMADDALTRTFAVSGYFAADINGGHRVELPGVSKDTPGGGGEAYFIWDAATLRVSRRAAGCVFLAYGREAATEHPVWGRFDSNGGGVFIEAENPGKVNEWLIDADEKPRLGVERSSTTTKLWHKPAGANKWVELVDLSVPPAQVRFYGFDSSGKTLYVSRPEPAGNWVLYGYDLEKREWNDPQLRVGGHDILPGDPPLMFADVDLNAPVFSAGTRDLAGVRTVTDGPKQVWLDAKMAALQRSLDATRIGEVNMILSADDAETRFAVLSWSARDPGSYGVFDAATSKLVRVAQRMPWIHPDEMGETFPFRCRAVDGLDLEGYLTKPPGAPDGPLPLVVLLREHPWRRDVWGFDPWVQFLATRGYAVLQVNHRGSQGYGPAFQEKGRGEMAGAIQADIEAAVQWAVRGKVADPKRVAVVGRGFGGTCALLALEREHAPYCCGAAIAPVTDWEDTLAKSHAAARHYWIDTTALFSAKEKPASLRTASPLPVADRIKAPVLLIHANRSSLAPVAGTQAFATALEKAGQHPETFFYDSEGGGRDTEQDTAAVFKKLENFLSQHLTGAELPAAVDAR